MSFDQVQFREFIQDKYAEWRGRGRETLQDFANYVGVSQQLMSNWYNGKFKRPPGAEVAKLLIDKFGLETYDVLGLPAPEDPVEFLPEPLRTIASEFRATIAERGVSGDSPEADVILDEIMKKLGYVLTSTKD